MHCSDHVSTFQHVKRNKNTRHSYFNMKKLTEDEVAQVEKRKEDVEYTCGGQLFQEPCLLFVEVKVQS